MAKTFRVWALWTDVSEYIGLIAAETEDDAKTKVAQRGWVSGLGRDRRFLGTHAVSTQG